MPSNCENALIDLFSELPDADGKLFPHQVFHLFPRLLAELRLIIWDSIRARCIQAKLNRMHLCLEPTKRTMPITLSINRESREYSLKTYRPPSPLPMILPTDAPPALHHFWFDGRVHTIYIKNRDIWDLQYKSAYKPGINHRAHPNLPTLGESMATVQKLVVLETELDSWKTTPPPPIRWYRPFSLDTFPSPIPSGYEFTGTDASLCVGLHQLTIVGVCKNDVEYCLLSALIQRVLQTSGSDEKGTWFVD